MKKSETVETTDYLVEKKHLVALEASGYRDYNKTLLILSSGAFAISLLMLERMSDVNYILFLVYSWLFWVISLLLELGSLSMYPKAIREESLRLQSNDADKAKILNPFFAKMRQLSIVSTASFGLGVFFFIIFILYNLNCF
jgi:hypothetical protein